MKDHHEGTRLILVRHGQTESNKSMKIQDEDSELSELGHRQAEAVGKRLARYDIDVIYCSSMKRARQTLDKISKHVDAPIHHTDTLVERSCKGWVGMTWKEVYEKYPNFAIKRKQLKDFRPPKGESLSMVQKRMLPYINKAIDKNKGKTILIVSHGTALRTLLGYYLGVPFGKRYKLNKNNCSISIIEYHHGHFNVMKINETAHVDEFNIKG